jgi:hypothetical protein
MRIGGEQPERRVAVVRRRAVLGRLSGQQFTARFLRRQFGSLSGGQ